MRRRQKRCIDSASARHERSSYRPSVPARVPLQELRRIAGPRNRCFYCSDGRGADVDHYVPLGRDPSLTFVWSNLLWVCPECNRSKSAQSPVIDGVSVLDPTIDDPWRYLILDSSTGVVAPRFGDPGFDPRGIATLRLLKALTWEEVIEGRARSIRRLREEARRLLSDGDSPSTRRGLLRAVEEDEYGVSRWFMLWDGANEEPFRAIKLGRPSLWRRLVVVAARE